MAGEREPVREHRGPLHERLRDRIRHDHGSHRRVGRRDPLGRRDDVGLVAVALAPEPVAEPAPRADDLVGDQQHAVPVADLPDPLEVAVLWNDAPTGVLHGLEDHRRDRVGALEQDPLLDGVGRPERVAILRPAVGVRVRHVAAARRERLELRPQGGNARGGQRSEGRAVVGDLAGDDLGARALAAHAVVVARELPGRLHGLRPTRCEEHAVEVSGRERGDLRGQLDRAWVRVAPVRVEAELAGLARRRLAQLGPAVAGVHAEESREAVEVALAVLVEHVTALAAHDDRHLVVGVGAHPGEMHPEVALRQVLQFAAAAVRRSGELELGGHGHDQASRWIGCSAR